MISIPEVRIYDIIEGILLHIKDDYSNAVDKNQSMLYYIFEDLRHIKKEYFKEALELFTRDNNNPRKIEPRMYYDAARAQLPTVHVTIPVEDQGEDQIGIGSGEYIDLGDDSNYRETVTKRFRTTTHIICTSKNESECTMMYHAIRAMLLSILEHFALIGLENVKISGQEVSLNENLAQNHIYHRGIGLSYTYCIEVPKWYNQQTVTDILLCKRKVDPINSPKIIDDERD